MGMRRTLTACLGKVNRLCKGIGNLSYLESGKAGAGFTDDVHARTEATEKNRVTVLTSRRTE